MADIEDFPRHIAVIMDGNGRWAKQRGLPRVEGHRAGVRSVRRLVRNCRKLEIPYLTIFAFSTENWGRPKAEVSALMSMLKRFIRKELPELKKNGIRVKVIGDLQRIPENVRKDVEWAISETETNDKLILAIALSYSGRDDIVRAARKVAERVKAGQLDPSEITEESFEEFLDTSGIPDPDLLIRTSGEQRISNFLLWQLAYTELYITPVLWPDFKKKDLIDAIKHYSKRERRFGYTGEQVEMLKRKGEPQAR